MALAVSVVVEWYGAMMHHHGVVGDNLGCAGRRCSVVIMEIAMIGF